ncbi:hypothetical protein SCYZ1_49 [Pseudomonas phage SCYZ1]|nr:hypothetical protein SCYZ1_49 [Pseudomonas phage SCYZ1]
MSLGFAGRNKTVTLTSKPQVIAEYNLHRHGLFIYNDAEAPCKIAFGTDPEAGDYFTLGAGNKIELDSIVPVGPVWATGTGPLHLMDNAMGDSTVGWTPQDLLPEFTDGKALWYDLSDAATVFEDTAAAVPATVGGPVGMILDKSLNGMNLTFVGGDKPIWDGKSISVEKDCKFVLPGFDPATWVFDQEAGDTYYAVGLAPTADNADRKYVFHIGRNASGAPGASLSYESRTWSNSGNPHWRDSFNGSTAWNPDTQPAINIGAPVVLGVRAAFSSRREGENTLFRNKVKLDTMKFKASLGDQTWETIFLTGKSSDEGYRGKFFGLFIRHTTNFVEDDFLKLQRWTANKIGVEV